MDANHCALFDEVDHVFNTLVDFGAPECTTWSEAATTADTARQQALRKEQDPTLEWFVERCDRQDEHGHGYLLEQPWRSKMKEDPALHVLQKKH